MLYNANHVQAYTEMMAAKALLPMSVQIQCASPGAPPKSAWETGGTSEATTDVARKRKAMMNLISCPSIDSKKKN